MRSHQPNLGALLAAVVVAVIGSTGVVLATPGAQITSSTISVGLFEDIDVRTNVDGHKVGFDTKGPSDVYVVSNVIAAGGHTGWHTHPGPSLITVKSGTVTAYSASDPTCTPMVFTAGQGFVDAGDGSIHILRNESGASAETIAFQVLPQGAPRRIDVPAPGNCPF